MDINEKSHKPNGFTRKEAFGVAIVLLLAVVIRVVYLFQYKASIPYYSTPILDSCYYDEWAKRVAGGQGYGPSPFYLAPLYPYVLGLIYKVFGHNLPAVYVLQALLGVTSLFLVYLISRRLFGHVSGLCAMALMTLYSPLLFKESKLLSETLAITLNLTSLLLLMDAPRRGTLKGYLPAGAVMGVAVICRPVMLLFVPLAALWLWMKSSSAARTRVACLLVFFTGLGLAVFPVTLRNYVIGKDFVPISTNAGVTFAQGNNPQSQGFFTRLPGFTGDIMTQQQEEMQIASRALGHPVKPSQSSSYWFGVGLKYIRKQPLSYIRLVGTKLALSLHAREMAASYSLYLEKRYIPILRALVLPFSLLAGLALWGFISGRRSVRSGDAALLMLYTFSIFVSLLLFQVSSRYRLPAAPALAVFAGYGLVRTVDAVRLRRVRQSACAAVCILLFLLFSLVPYPAPAIAADVLVNLGAGFLAEDQISEAVDCFEEAVKVNPDNVEAHRCLAEIASRDGDTEGAIEHYREILRIEPADAATHNTLGIALAGQGKISQAAQHFSLAIKLNPANADSHNNLAILLVSAGRSGEAIRHYREALRLKPDNPEIANNLAWILATNKDARLRNGREALKLADAACRATDFSNPLALNTLAAACAELGMFNDAVDYAAKALKIAEDAGAAEIAEQTRNRLELYKRRQPLRI